MIKLTFKRMTGHSLQSYKDKNEFNVNRFRNKRVAHKFVKDTDKAVKEIRRGLK